LKLVILPAALLVLAFGLVGCSSSDDGDDTPAPPAAGTAQNDGPSSATTPSGGSTSGVQAVSVKSGENGDSYFFEVSQTNLKTGKVKVTLENSGPERPHTFIVKKLDNSGNLAEISQVEPRLSGSVEFDLTAAGTYQFQCDLRGHADRGQRGSFTVSN